MAAGSLSAPHRRSAARGAAPRHPLTADPRKRLRSAQAGELVNGLYQLAERVEPLPGVTASPDPAGNVLLAVAEAGSADYLISGDKRHLLSLKRHQSTQIVNVRTMLEILDAQT